MPLQTAQLAAAIINIFTEMRGITANPEQAAQQFAHELAQALEVWVKTGTVVTNGSPTTQTGAIVE